MLDFRDDRVVLDATAVVQVQCRDLDDNVDFVVRRDVFAPGGGVATLADGLADGIRQYLQKHDLAPSKFEVLEVALIAAEAADPEAQREFCAAVGDRIREAFSES